jgi:hypothetical protein
LSSSIRRIRWPMWFACWGTSVFSALGLIWTVPAPAARSPVETHASVSCGRSFCRR